MMRCARECAALLLIATCLLISMGSAEMAAAQTLTPAVEGAVVGGGMCEFAEGVATGLTIGGFFGCVACAVSGGVIALGALFAGC